MPLESGSFIDDLTPANPPSSDPAGQGDDHIRLIKATVQGTFPQMGSIFGQVRRQDTALSISSTWNTNHFIVSASATATVVLTLPPAASITTGFFVDITTIGTGTVSLAASGAGSINGAATLSIPRLSSTRAYFVTGTGWLADTVPHAQGGTSVLTNLAVDGTLSVSGATALNAVTISGAATLKSTLSVSGQSVLAGLTVAGTSTLSGTVVLSNGQLKFPAVVNPSADANTLDDYEEGTWTPILGFPTPGDTNTVLSIQTGWYTKVGNLVTVGFAVATTTFTHSTGTGNLQIVTLPFTPGDFSVGAVRLGGIAISPSTTFDTVTANVFPGSDFVNFIFNNLNSGAPSTLTHANHVSGTNVTCIGTITYKV